MNQILCNANALDRYPEQPDHTSHQPPPPLFHSPNQTLTLDRQSIDEHFLMEADANYGTSGLVDM